MYKNCITTIVLICIGVYTAYSQSSCILCTTTNAVVIGAGSQVSSSSSITIGNNNVDSGNFSSCIGNFSKAIGNGSMVIGGQCTATGANSFAAGLANVSKGDGALSFGNNDSAQGKNSIAMGTFSKTSGENALAIGFFAYADSLSSVAIGTHVWAGDNSNMVIGSGTFLGNPLKNDVPHSLMIGFNSTKPTIFVGPAPTSDSTGNVGIGTSTPLQKLDVAGNIAVGGRIVISGEGKWMGDSAGIKGPAGANGSRWFSGAVPPSPSLVNDSDFYLNTINDSVYELLKNVWQPQTCLKGSSGRNDTASGYNALVFGNSSIASDTNAIALGNHVQATSNGSIAFGHGITSSIPNSLSIGFGTGVGMPLLFAGAAVVGGAAFIGVGTNAAPPTGVILSVAGGVGVTGAIAADGGITVNGDPAIKSDGSIWADGKQMIDKDGNFKLTSGPGIKINANNIASKTTDTLWNANKLQNNHISSKTPVKDNLLKWSGTEWTPDTLKDGTGITVAGSTISARTTDTLWNANKLHNSRVSAKAPVKDDLLKWSGSEWAPDTLKDGAGITVIGSTISARTTDTLWNANKLQNNRVSAKAPVKDDLLKWSGGEWAPDTLKDGTGITVTGSTISARTTDTLWNANKLQNNRVSAVGPRNKQVLQWDSTSSAWAPASITAAPSGWVIDSAGPGHVLMHPASQAFVGIGTAKPQTLFQVQGGHTANPDSSFSVDSNGNVGIGTDSVDSRFKLSVKGELRAVGITVESDWADYVFDACYALRPLKDIEKYISEHKHLPGVPSSGDINSHGLDIGKTEKILMEKIEELTLYMIALQKQNDQLADKVLDLQAKIK